MGHIHKRLLFYPMLHFSFFAMTLLSSGLLFLKVKLAHQYVISGASPCSKKVIKVCSVFLMLHIAASEKGEIFFLAHDVNELWPCVNLFCELTFFFYGALRIIFLV